MTQILNLPLASFSATVGTNEDWTDSWAYEDAQGNPIPGDGIALVMMMRRTANAATAEINAGSVTSTDAALARNGTLSWGGIDGNVLGLAVPESTMTRIAAGAYVAEVQGIGDGYRKTIAQIAVTVMRGIVR